MDKEPKATRWSWLPAHMPGVQKLLAEKRKEWGDAHVNQCWQHGVVLREPGWFFAREGPLTVGTPENDEMLAWFASLGPKWESGKGSAKAIAETPQQALLYMRRPEASHGANS